MRKRASKFLSLFLVLAMVCSLFGSAMAAEEETVTPYEIPDVDGKIVILHTNDTHGADLAAEGTSFGMAGVAQLKKDFEAAGAQVLLLSAGDSIQGKPLVSADQGKSAIAQPPQSRGGLALANVDSRIRLLFGDKYGLHAFSTPGVGTDVEITLPMIASDRDIPNREALV